MNATGLPTTELRSAGIIRSMAQPGRNLPRNAPDWLSLSDACAVSPPPPAGCSSRCSRVCSPHQTPMVAPERARVSSVVESKSVVGRPLICRTNDPAATPAMFDSVTTGGSGPRRVIAPSSGTLRAENEPEPYSTKPSFSNSSRSSLELPFDASGIRYESRVAIDGGGVSPDDTHIHDADIDSESALTQLSGCGEFFSWRKVAQFKPTWRPKRSSRHRNAAHRICFDGDRDWQGRHGSFAGCAVHDDPRWGTRAHSARPQGPC